MELHTTEETVHSTPVDDTQEKQSSDLHGNLTVHAVFVIIICSVGLLANSCAFLVLVKSSIIKTTTGVYLSCLALTDNFALVFNLIYKFTDIVLFHNALCKFTATITTLFMTISWHLIVWMSVDRGYLVVFPHKPKQKRQTAFLVVGIGVSIIVLLYSVQLGLIFELKEVPQHVNDTSGPTNSSLLEMPIESMTIFDSSMPPDNSTASNMSAFKHGNLNETLNESSPTKQCTISPRYLNFFQKVYIPFDLIVSCLLAPIIVIVCNLTIIIYVKKKSTVAPLGASSNTPKHDKRVTRILLLVSILFVICVLPSGIQFTLVPFIYGDIFEAINPENIVFQIFNGLLLVNQT